jgi:hypothetical protein
MPKQIIKSQQSGLNGVDILNSVFIKKNGITEFSFVELPQQHDFGIDGILNIFENNIISRIFPICQVKATKDDYITFTKEDYEELQKNHSLIILFAVNKSFSNKPKVGYYFPQFQEHFRTVSKFPYFISCTKKSKKELLENIIKYNEELNNKIARNINSEKSLKGGDLSKVELNDGWVMDHIKDKNYGFSNDKLDNFNMNFNMSFPLEDTIAKDQSENLKLFFQLKKDEVEIDIKYLTKFDPSISMPFMDFKNAKCGKTILKQPILREFILILDIGGKTIRQKVETFQSIEKNCLILRTASDIVKPTFKITIETLNSTSIHFELVRENITRIDEIFNIYSFLNSNGVLGFYEEKEYGKELLFETNEFHSMNHLIDLEHFEVIKKIYLLDKFYSNELKSFGIELSYPFSKYSNDDMLNLLALSENLEKPTFFVKPNNNELITPELLFNNTFYSNGVYRIFTIQNKTIKLISDGEFLVKKYNETNGRYLIQKLDNLNTRLELDETN